MKVCGFTIIRNAEKYDYPVVESINSLLPIVDHMIVLVGESEDHTKAIIQGISSKIEVIDSVWDDSMREGGRVLALETDKAFQLIPPDYDWAFYLQADEVIHEEDYAEIRHSMKKYLHDTGINGLLFDYNHFYGSYDYLAKSSKWYRKEIRIIKNDKNIYSYKDAQGFRKKPNSKLTVVEIKATIYHYGWVKPPSKMQAKQENFNKLWHNDEWVEAHVAKKDEFDYGGVDKLSRFTSNHPVSMLARIASINWKFDHDITKDRLTMKEKVRQFIKKLTGWLPGEYKNYRLK